MKQLSSWIIRLIVLLGLLVALVLIHRHVAALRATVQANQRQLESNPEEELYIANVQADLSKRASDLERIRSLAPNRDNLVQAVSAIEAEGKKYSTQVQVSDVKDSTQDGALTSSGPIQDIRIKVTGSGEAVALLQFLYGVEHLPYVLYLDSWNITGGPGQTGGQLFFLPSGHGSAPETPQASLTADIIMSIQPSNE